MKPHPRRKKHYCMMCGGIIINRMLHAKYCLKCFKIMERKRRAKIRICVNCGKQLEIGQRSASHKYYLCSWECLQEYHDKLKK